MNIDYWTTQDWEKKYYWSKEFFFFSVLSSCKKNLNKYHVIFDIWYSKFPLWQIPNYRMKCKQHWIQFETVSYNFLSKLLGKNISSENKQPVFIQILFGLPLEPEGPLQIHLLHQKHDLVRLSSFIVMLDFIFIWFSN